MFYYMLFYRILYVTWGTNYYRYLTSGSGDSKLGENRSLLISVENQGTEFDVGEDISDREAMNRYFREDKHGG